jgi:hypothetical protein
MHINLLCACWLHKASKGRHPWSLVVSSRLLSSLVWAQLMPLVPASGIRPLLPQYGYPIHGVRAHPLTGIRNKTLSIDTAYSPIHLARQYLEYMALASKRPETFFSHSGAIDGEFRGLPSFSRP